MVLPIGLAVIAGANVLVATTAGIKGYLNKSSNAATSTKDTISSAVTDEKSKTESKEDGQKTPVTFFSRVYSNVVGFFSAISNFFAGFIGTLFGKK